MASVCGRHLVLLASVRDIDCVGEVEEVTKQELAHIARLMYDLQEYCRYIDELNNHEECNGCTFLYDHVKCRLIALTKDNKIPCDNWNITKADVERLERESNEISMHR